MQLDVIIIIIITLFRCNQTEPIKLGINVILCRMQANSELVPDFLRLALNDAATYDKVCDPYFALFDTRTL